MMLLQVDTITWLEPVAKVAPVIAVLLWIIFYMVKQIDKKEVKLDAKDAYIQTILTDNIATLSQVNSTMDKMLTTINTGDNQLKTSILEEAQKTQQAITALLIELKKVQYSTNKDHHQK